MDSPLERVGIGGKRCIDETDDYHDILHKAAAGDDPACRFTETAILSIIAIATGSGAREHKIGGSTYDDITALFRTRR